MIEFLILCLNQSFRHFAAKSFSNIRKVEWCGSIVNEQNFPLIPRSIVAIQIMEAFVMAIKLNQIKLCYKWRGNCVAEFYRKVKHIDGILKRAHSKARNRERNVLNYTSPHNPFWTINLLAALDCIQDSLHNAVRLVLPKRNQAIYICTNALKPLWTIEVARVMKEGLK